MQARLQKWGNSEGIRIPSSLLKSLNLKANDIVEKVSERDLLSIMTLTFACVEE